MNNRTRISSFIMSKTYLKIWIWFGGILFVSSCVQWGVTLQPVYAFLALFNFGVTLGVCIVHDAGGIEGFLTALVERRRELLQREREAKYPLVDDKGMRWRMEGGRPVSELADLVMERERDTGAEQ